jgi:hypothetical protein
MSGAGPGLFLANAFRPVGEYHTHHELLLRTVLWRGIVSFNNASHADK